jgi:hypothetical protein
VAPRLIAGAVVAVGVTGVAAGCGGGGSHAQLSGVARAVRETEQAKTARYSLVYSEAGLPNELGQGAVDFSSYRGTSTLRSKGSRVPYQSVWDISGVWAKAAGIQLFARTSTGPRHIRKASRPWVKIPADYFFEQMGALKLLDLSRILDLLKVGTFHATGREDVRGVPTQRYRGTLDFTQFIKAFLPPDEWAKFTATSHRGIRVAVWVDGKGLLRKVAYNVPALTAGSPAARATFELYDLGRPVDISPPPAEEVMDVAYLFQTQVGG